MKPLDSFASRLLPWVPNCPEPLWQQVLLDACIEFCELTRVISVVTDPVASVVGQGQYSVDLPAESAAAVLTGAWYLNNPLAAVSSDQVRRADALTGVGSRGTPTCYFVVDADTVNVFPPPAVADPAALVFQVCTKPTRTATTVADELVESWAEPIVAGALYRLMFMPGQFYSSGDTALMKREEFLDGVRRAKAQAVRGRIRAEATVRPMQGRRFGP